MPPRKRPQAESESTSAATRRRSQRVSSGIVGVRKSAYFEDDDNDDDDDQSPPPRKVARTTKKGAVTAAATARKATAKARENESSDDVLQATSDGDNGDAASEDTDDDDDDDDEGYDDGDAEVSDGGESEDEVEDYEEEEEEEEEYDAAPPPPPKKRGRPAAATATAKSAAAKNPSRGRGKANTDSAKPKNAGKAKTKSKLEDEDDDDDEDEDEDGDDRITFIPLPQLRDTGGVEYADTRLHRNTMLFLRDLKANNQRSWLKMHDPEYRRSLKDWESFVETLTERIIDADETIPELPLKDVVFRIYRDIRFTKDPTPYKAHYSAAWSRTGRKGPYACYYVHAEPGRCLVGGGLWQPDSEALARVRASIDERPHRIRRVLLDPAFRRTFLPDAGGEGGKKKNKQKEKKTKGKGKRKSKDAGGGEEEEEEEQQDDEEKAVLDAFARANAEGALKTKPKGFHPEHRDIELLKLRSFTISKQIPDEVLLGDDAQDRIMDIIRPMVPFITFLNRTARPDPDEETDSDVEEEEEEEGGED
ncbi:hypothetical protein F4809DRAFT_166433 [Biscogniauxia mediterranea]|nr:hypothetical protein F4809DRAFT_166433 [Biscogniauxia mediterranea]